MDIKITKSGYTTFMFTVEVPEEIYDSAKRRAYFERNLRGYGNLIPSWQDSTNLKISITTNSSEEEIIQRLKEIMTKEFNEVLSAPLSSLR